MEGKPEPPAAVIADVIKQIMPGRTVDAASPPPAVAPVAGGGFVGRDMTSIRQTFGGVAAPVAESGPPVEVSPATPIDEGSGGPVDAPPPPPPPPPPLVEFVKDLALGNRTIVKVGGKIVGAQG